MKSLRTMGVLLRYNLWLLPWYIWPLLALIALGGTWLTSIEHVWVIGGLGTTGLDGSLLLWIIMGNMFFKFGRGYAGGRIYEGGQIPEGEFLLARPILRRTAYFPRLGLFFIIMLATPLLQVYVASAKPDLSVEFYNWVDPAIIAGHKSFYREQFPYGTVIHRPNPGKLNGAYDSTLVVPSGALLVAWWNLIVAIVVGLALQIILFSRSPSKLSVGGFLGTLFFVYTFASIFIRIMFPPLEIHITLYERAFFLFARHPTLFALSTLAAFLFVQGIALIRIRHFEVI